MGNRFVDLAPPPADIQEKEGVWKTWLATNEHRPNWMRSKVAVRNFEENFGIQLLALSPDQLDILQKLGLSHKRLQPEENAALDVWLLQLKARAPFLQPLTLEDFRAQLRSTIGQTLNDLHPENSHTTLRGGMFDDGTHVRGAGDQTR